MSRYVSPTENLKLFANDGDAVYSFESGVLNLSGDIDDTLIQVLYPSAGTAAKKAGEDTLYFKRPILVGGTNALTDTEEYEALTTVTYNGSTYKRGKHFTCDTVTAFTGKAQLAIPSEYRNTQVLEENDGYFRARHMLSEDGLPESSYWDDTTAGGFTPNSPGYTV